LTDSKAVDADRRGGLAALLAHPYLLLTLAPLFWGGNMVAAKLAVGIVPPFVLLFARFLGALLLVAPLALPHLKRDWPALRQAAGWLFLYGAVGFTAFNACLYVAASYTTAINSSIEQASIPVFVLIGNFALFGVRGKPLQIAGLVLTILGVMLVATHGDLETIMTFRFNVGDLLVLLACLIYAAYALTLRYRPAVHWLSFLGATMVGAVLGAGFFLVTLGGGFGALSALGATSPLGWAIIAYVALFPSLLSQLFFAQGVGMIGPNRASLFNNLIPVFGTILSVLVLGEGLEPYHLLAATIVVAGIVLAEVSARQAA
jgi:drug/metabolite transporter (DMT)-like permease